MLSGRLDESKALLDGLSEVRDAAQARLNRVPVVGVALSGGVDSAVTAWMLREAGFNTRGVYMSNWSTGDEKGGSMFENVLDGCDSGECDQLELLKAESVARCLDIPFEHVNFEREYWEDVFQSLLAGLEQGTTPNPDVLCNRHIKFGSLWDHIVVQQQADFLATGHYVQLECSPSGLRVMRGVDPVKDQSYWLAMVKPGRLERTLCPLGGLHKKSVRAIAQHVGLPVAASKDSYGICFIGKRRFSDFIGQYLAASPGPFVCVDTKTVVGHHKGVHSLTIGQRARIGGQKCAYTVVGKWVKDNTILVASHNDHPALFSSAVDCAVSWLDPSRVPEGSFAAQCQHRVRTGPAAATVMRNDNDDDNTEGTLEDVRVGFENPVHSVCAGQTLAVYSHTGEQLLGGGAIQTVHLANSVDNTP